MKKLFWIVPAVVLMFSGVTHYFVGKQTTPVTVEIKPAAGKFVVPDQQILGAEKPIPLGELVDLSVSPIKQPSEHLVSTSYVWKVFEDGFKEKRVKQYDNGVFFGAGIKPKKLLALVSVTHLYIVKVGEVVAEVTSKNVVYTAEVIIGEVPPEPPPTPPTPPVPPAPPTPVFPDGKYGLAKTSYDLAFAKVSNADARIKGAAAYSQSLASVAAAIAAGTFSEMEDVLKQTKTKNTAALMAVGVNPSDWDVFGQEMERVIYKLYTDKKLNTVDELRTAWVEISEGLSKVTK